jgi:ubiquinone/menaquinone biosynthesis C-methylase UbiE
MNLTEENLREKKFHDKLQSKTKGRFENIFYKAIYNANEDFYKYLELNSNNSLVLDYGCGIGHTLENVANFNPKKITGIDISEVSIEKAKNRIKELGLKNIDLKVDNCEKTSFRDNEFDIVYGTGILHHLQISKCIEEILRILKPGGKLLFIEPIGTNPIINLYRKLTPNSRSKDEHPLTIKDFNLIKKSFFKTDVKYYGFLTLVFFPFYTNPKKSFFFRILKNVDQILFKIKIFRPFSWSTLIIAEKG